MFFFKVDEVSCIQAPNDGSVTPQSRLVVARLKKAPALQVTCGHAERGQKTRPPPNRLLPLRMKTAPTPRGHAAEQEIAVFTAHLSAAHSARAIGRGQTTGGANALPPALSPSSFIVHRNSVSEASPPPAAAKFDPNTFRYSTNPTLSKS
jgi:hypothetical protein